MSVLNHSQAMELAVESLPYIDFQHDALSVFDDVEQGVVLREDVWISAYKMGSESVHGKARVEAQDGGGVDLTSRDGVKLCRVSKSNFSVSVPALDVVELPVRFPKQIMHPPYVKKKATSAPLHVNCISHSPKAGRLLIGGPDGYCTILSTSSSSPPLDLLGHVGDVLDCKWFPSGEVVLTSSSDLSIRVFSANDGINPRTLRGHTRAVTALYIVGVGREVLSASKDGSVRLWEVGSARELKKWVVDGRRAIDALVVVGDEKGKESLGMKDEERVVLAVSPDGTISGFPFSAPSFTAPAFVTPSPVASNLVSVAYSPDMQLLVTGHANGTIAIRSLSTLLPADPATEPLPESQIKLVRRNESSIYSLAFVPSSTGSSPSPVDKTVDLLVGTASGLPCRLHIDKGADGFVSVVVAEEYAGWEATSVESWAVASDGVWCAGGEGGIRRY